MIIKEYNVPQFSLSSSPIKICKNISFFINNNLIQKKPHSYKIFLSIVCRKPTQKYVLITITIHHNNSQNLTTNNNEFLLSAQYQENNKINEQNYTDIIHFSTMSNIPFVQID